MVLSLDKLNFEMADAFFRNYLFGTTGFLGRDQKRRNEKSKRGSQPFEPGRSPVSAADSLASLFGQFNWNTRLDEAELFSNWESIVGEQSAEASTPEELKKGLLTIRCRSTAWATQLRLLEGEILPRIQEKYPKLEIAEIRFIGPNAPSWKKGSRSVPGRGPRDTYG